MMHSPEFLKDMKARLDEEELRLLRDLREIGIEDPGKPGVFLPKLSEQTENQTEDDNSATSTALSDDLVVIEGLQEELRDVTKAKESIEKGTYGLCKYCQKPIDPKRLEARPTSSACISCKKTLTQEL